MRMRFFSLCKKLSKNSDYESYKLGATIVSGTKVLGLGFNKKRTHPMSKSIFCNIHAELAAVINSKMDSLKGCDIYVYRETKDGIPAMARPCPACYSMLVSLQVKNIYYSCDGGYKREKVYA